MPKNRLYNSFDCFLDGDRNTEMGTRRPWFAHPLGICNSPPPPPSFSRCYIHACVRLVPFLASPHFHINSGGGLEPIKIDKPQVVSEISRINVLSGVLICVVS